MIRHKGFVSILLAAITSLVVFVATGISIANKNSQAFAGDGYILAAEAMPSAGGGSEAMTEPEPLYFSAGTRYRGRYPESLTFMDVQGSQRSVDYYSFVHYADNSVSALADGVLVNMDDINMGLVNHYGLRSGVVMVANGDGYTVENNGNQMNFHNFFWKLSDSHFLLRSDNLVLTLPDGTQENVDGFLEAQYIEEGVVQLTDKSHRWQVVSDGTGVAMSNGITYDFGDKVVRDAEGFSRMSFQELLLDADDNIQVQSAEEWVAPEFNFEVIDGQEGQHGEAGEEGVSGQQGQSGTSGQNGQDGEDGEEGGAGDDGEAGNEGTHGRAGTAGKTGTSGTNAASGAQGSAGSLTDKETQAQAAITITDFELTAGTLKVTLKVIDEDGVLGSKGAIQLLNPQGKEVGEWASADGNLNPDANKELEFYDDLTATVVWDGLNPDTEYRLVVSSDYTLKTVTGQRDYINRTFFTDSTGMQLEKVYATETGFSMVLTRKNYSEATGALITIYDGSGNEADTNRMMTYTVNAGEFDSDGVVELNTDSGFTVDRSLTSNTSYIIKLESVVDGSPKDTGNRQTWKTLKKKPSLGIAEGFANSQTYFNLSVKNVKDDDAAIVQYRYDVYEASKTTIAKTLTSNDSKAVALYIDEDVIKRGVSYRVRVTASYYDNEKTAEVQTEPSEPFIMGDMGDISITFERDSGSNTVTELKGTLMIAPKDAGLLLINPSNPLTVEFRSGLYYERKFEFTESELNSHLEGGVYKIPFHLTGLKQNSPYTVAVWGSVQTGFDPMDNTLTYEYKRLGDYVLSTTSHTRILLDMEPADSTGSAIGTYIYLGAADDTRNPDDYEDSLKAIRAVEVKLYTGSTPSEGNLIGTALAVDDALNTNVPYQNTIAGTYYGAKGRLEDNRIYVDESTFLKTTAELTASQYCIEVSAVYDYTFHYVYEYDERKSDYANTLEREGRYSLVRVRNASVPDFPKPLTSGVSAKPIRFGELALKCGITYDGPDKGNYLDDTIVGYELQARFDNSGALGKSVTYYAFTQTDFNEYKEDSSSSKGDDVMEWRKNQSGVDRPWMQVTLPVANDATDLPGMIILFINPTAGGTNISVLDNNLLVAEADENKDPAISGVYDTYYAGTTPIFFARNMERGWHYIFSYTARLGFGGGNNYKYPNNYNGRFIPGETLLSSETMDAGRQAADVKMYLYKTMNDGSNKTRGLADWRYKYTDLDGTTEVKFNDINSFADIQKVFGVAVGSPYQLVDPGSAGTETDGYKTLRLNILGNMEYTIEMKQKRYHEDDERNELREKIGEEEIKLAKTWFTLPVLDSTVKNTSQGIMVGLVPPSSGFGNTVQFTFKFGSAVSGMENRIERIRIWAVGQEKSSQNYYGFTGQMGDGSYYVGYDLSMAGNKLDTVNFGIEIYYDSGFSGEYYVETGGTDDRFAIQTSTGNYVVKRYVVNSLGATVLNNQKSNTSAWYSSYKVKPTTSTAPATQIVDKAWQIINIHSAVQDENDSSYPQPVLNLRYTGEGSYDAVEGYYPILNQMKMVTYGTDGSLSHTITDLTPSVSNAWFTRGLTTIRGTFATNSYHLIGDSTPPGLSTGKYVHVSVYQYYSDSTSGGYYSDPAWDGYVAIDSVDATKTYEFLATGLESGGHYRVEFKCQQSGGEELLWDTSRDLETVYSLKLLDSMSIDDLNFSEIQYVTYLNKYVNLGYTLELTDGFEIRYSLEKMQPNGSYAPDAGHDEIMAAMGYEKQGGIWGKMVGSEFVPVTLTSSMLETISLKPGGIMSPGNMYCLTITAVDPTDAVVGSNKIEFTWPILNKPDFYVTTTPLGTNTSISIKLDPIDINKVIVDGNYYIVLWDGNDIKHFASYNVEDGLKDTGVIPGLAANTSYTLAIYAETDMNNAGGLSGLSLTKDDLQIMSETEKQRLLIYQSTERTMESWGGRYDSVNIRFNGAGNIRIDMFNAYNLDRIDEIRATVYIDGASKNFILKKTSSQTTMFTPIGGSETDSYVVLNTDGSYSTSGIYSVTCSFMENGKQLFRESKNAVID